MELTPGIIELDKAAQIITERLGASIGKHNISDTQALLESLDWKVIGNTIHILYNYYGVMREMGVGRGVTLSEVAGSNRKPKKWATKVLYREVVRLNQFVAEQMGKRTVDVVANISQSNLTKDAHIQLMM